MTEETRNADELAGDIEATPEVATQTGQVYAADPANATAPPSGAPQDASAQGADKSSVPIWVLVVVVAIFLACVCVMMATGVGVLGYLSSSQPDAPVIIVPPTQEKPAEAPPEQPTQPPPAQPTEAPPEPPAEEQQPEAEQLPTEPDSGGSACIPLAGGLVLAPLLVLANKSGSRRRSNL